MSNQTEIISHEKPQAVSSSTVSRKHVLVFSPDTDLARFLLLNLEDKFQIVREHRLEHFEQAVKELIPDLILIDLSHFLPTLSNNSTLCANNKHSSNHCIACLYVTFT